MVIVSILPHSEFGSVDHRENALHFTKNFSSINYDKNFIKDKNECVKLAKMIRMGGDDLFGR